MNLQNWAASFVARVVVLSIAMPSLGYTKELPGPANTERILEAIEKNRDRYSSEGLKASRSLNIDGDRAYKKRRYSAAHTNYYSSYPNYPNAYAYIMAGDSHWRAVLLFQEAQARKQTTNRSACVLDNHYFAHDLTFEVTQTHEVGLALAERENDQRFMRSTLYRRARESATCLQDMARRYAAEPPTTCIDLTRLRTCLGAPLIK